MFPLFLLLALGAVAFAASQKPGGASLDADLARLQKENPTAFAEVSRIMREGASAAVLAQYGAQLDAQGYHAIAKKFGDMAKAQTTSPGSAGADPASIAKSALASGSADVMKGAAQELRARGFNDAATALENAAAKVTPGGGAAPQVAQTIEPSMSSDLQTQLNNALATVADPAKLNALAALLDQQGYPTAARVLREKATAILIQSEATQAVKAADAVMKGQPIPAPDASPSNPTTAAVTASNAAAVVNKVAEAMAQPTPDAVRAVAQQAVQLSQSASVTGDYRVLSGDSPWKISIKFTGDGTRWHELIRANPQKSTGPDGNFKYLNAGEVIHLPPAWASNPANRALLVAAQTALQNPSAASLASVAQGAAALAAQSATPNTAAAAAAAQAAAAQLAANPTASQASRTAAVTAAAANTAINSAGVPISQSGKTTYVVQKGDSAWKIAQTITGNGNRYPELINANIPPNGTKTISGGNFTDLFAGEVLKLPSSWVSAAPKTTLVADLPMPGGAGSTAPDWTQDLARMKTDNPSLYTSTMNVKSMQDPAAYMKASQILIANPSNPAGYYPALSKAFSDWAAQMTMYGTSQPAVMPISTTAPSPSAAPTYTVLSGDSPWKIAQKLVGDGNRWRELVAANPQKSKAADGSFKYLNPGEVLNLPASWASAPIATTGYRPAYPGRNARQMGHMPMAA